MVLLLSKNNKFEKRRIIHPENNDDTFYQYALTVALNHRTIESNPQRISKIKSFIDHYNWKEIDFPSHKIQSLNKTIRQLLLISVAHNTEERRLAHKSKHRFKLENQ